MLWKISSILTSENFVLKTISSDLAESEMYSTKVQNTKVHFYFTEYFRLYYSSFNDIPDLLSIRTNFPYLHKIHTPYNFVLLFFGSIGHLYFPELGIRKKKPKHLNEP